MITMWQRFRVQALLAVVLVCGFSGSAAADEVLFFPDSPNVVVSLNWGAVLKGKTYAGIADKVAKLDVEKADAFFSGLLGIPLDKVSRLTLCGKFTGDDKTSTSVFTASTLQPITIADIKAKKKGFLFSEIVGHKDIKAGEFTICQEITQTIPIFGGKRGPKQDGSGYCLPEKNLVLFGPVDELKKILARNKKPDMSANFKAGLETAGFNHGFSLVIDVEGMPEAQRDSMTASLAKTFPAVKGLTHQVKYLAVKIDEDNSVKGTARLVCKNADAAADARKLADTVMADLKRQLAEDPKSPAELKDAAKGAQEILSAVKMSVKENAVHVDADVDRALIVRIVGAIHAAANKKPNP